MRNLFEEIVLNCPESIIKIDEDGTVRVFNRACEDLFGYCAEEVLGGSVVKLYESESQAREVKGRLKDSNGRVQGIEVRVRDKSGVVIPISLSATLLFDSVGNRIGSFSVFRDLREIKRLQKQLETQRYFENLVMNSPDPTIVIDTVGVVKIFNSECEKLFGYRMDDAVGKSILQFYSSSELARDINNRILESPDKKIQSVETVTKDVDGNLIPVSLSASLLYEDGEHIGSLGVFKDIREAKKMQDQVAKSETLATIGRLAHVVGHEIGHDLAAAQHLVEALLNRSGEGELRDVYEVIRSSLWEAHDKLRNMLMASRPKEPQKRNVGVSELLLSLQAKVNREAIERGIQIRVPFPEADALLFVDPEQIGQVFFNLFSNSVVAIESKEFGDGQLPEIVVMSWVSNGKFIVEWSDNGVGIEEKDRRRIFEAFYTSRRPGARAGHGLGLFLVNKIVADHDGDVSLVEGSSKGAIFRVSLPIGGSEGLRLPGKSGLA